MTRLITGGAVLLALVLGGPAHAEECAQDMTIQRNCRGQTGLDGPRQMCSVYIWAAPVSACVKYYELQQ